MRQPWFLLTCSRTLRRAQSSRECDQRNDHAPSTSVAQFIGSLCKALVNNFMNTASSEELYREVDHDLKLDEDTFQPAAAVSTQPSAQTLLVHSFRAQENGNRPIDHDPFRDMAHISGGLTDAMLRMCPMALSLVRPPCTTDKL